MSTVRKMLATNDTFAEVADLLFGGGADDLITKMNPTQSDLATKERKKRGATAALSGVGAAAGAGGLVLSTKELHHGAKTAPASIKGMGRMAHSVKNKKVAAALLPLEVAGLGGELMATKILHGDTKKKPPGALVKKDLGEMLNNSAEGGQLTRAKIPSPKRLAQKKGLEYTKKGASKASGKFRQLPTGMKGTADVEKIWSGEICKVNDEKQQIFGWASVVEVNGEPVVDLQGDAITAEEMEKAGYEYVMKSRKGGDMHLRDDWEPVQKSEMIESFIVTDDKRQAMGLPDDVPTGWWVGFQVRDPDVWAKVKSGERTGFSIHGRGKRTPA